MMTGNKSLKSLYWLGSVLVLIGWDRSSNARKHSKIVFLYPQGKFLVGWQLCAFFMSDLWLVHQFICCWYKMEIRWSVWQRQVTCFDRDPQRLQSSLFFYLNRTSAVLRSFLLVFQKSTLSLSCQKLNLVIENKTLMFHTKPSFSSLFTFFENSFWAAKNVVFFYVQSCRPSSSVKRFFSFFWAVKSAKEKIPQRLAKRNTDSRRHFRYFCILWNRCGLIVKC